jgi:hypothetical protein
MTAPVLLRDEQERIAHRMKSMQEIIDTAARHNGALKALKSGLMADLLTGRVRVSESMLKKAAANV